MKTDAQIILIDTFQKFRLGKNGLMLDFDFAKNKLLVNGEDIFPENEDLEIFESLKNCLKNKKTFRIYFFEEKDTESKGGNIKIPKLKNDYKFEND